MLRKVIISGGGTGGHIFPAIAIADEIKRRYPECEILFVGALGKMEMEKVPQAGYEIIGLPIRGIQRKLTYSNLWVPFRFLYSIHKARQIIRKFRPERVVGVGGYASSALIYAASAFRIPILIQEQNSYAGLTNKWLAAKAHTICVAYPGMEKYFPSSNIVFTGNPVRSGLSESRNMDRKDARRALNFNPDKPVLLVTGGSLGAGTINRVIQAGLESLQEAGIQVYWQTGKNFTADTKGMEGVKAEQFITDMATAYAAADFVVARAGALTVSELSLLGKAAVLVPSPNVAEDHQTKNAKALADRGAAILVPDREAEKKLCSILIELAADKLQQKRLEENISNFATPDALKDIVNQLDRM